MLEAFILSAVIGADFSSWAELEARVSDHDARIAALEAKVAFSSRMASAAKPSEPCPAGRCAVCGCSDAASCGCRSAAQRASVTPQAVTFADPHETAVFARTPSMLAARVEPTVVVTSRAYSPYPTYATEAPMVRVCDPVTGTCQLVPSGRRAATTYRRGPLFGGIFKRRGG